MAKKATTKKKAVTKASDKAAVSKAASKTVSAKAKASSRNTKTKKSASNSAKSPIIKAEPQASVPKAVQGTGKTYLSSQDLAYFRQILLEKLHQLRGDVDSIETDALHKSGAGSGNLSTMPIHMADLGSDTFEQDFALGLMSGERKIVVEIIAALKRIEEGTYGICEGTGKPIPRVRLEACPWARYCVEYAAKIEKGLVNTKDKPAQKKAPKQHEEEESDDAAEAVEPQDEEDDDEDEFDHVEADPDLDDLYEIDDTNEEPFEETHP